MEKLLTVIERLQSIIGFVNFVALTVVVTLQILTRFVIESPLLWTEEVARFLLFWLVLNGAALAVFRKRHFVIELFDIDHIDNRLLKRLLQLIPVVCILFVGLIMTFYGAEYALLGRFRVVPISGINMMYVYLAIPLSGAIISIYSLCQLIALSTRGEDAHA